MIQIPRHYIDNAVGQGGMATVYRARHTLLEQERAVKIMSPNLTHQLGFKESFIYEGKIVASLKHPNIVAIYDIGEHEGHYFMSMEYLDGGSLEEKLSSHSLPLPDILKILEQIGSALDCAHQKNLIHRDIKPANILFNAQGDAILTDFGISKQQDTKSYLTQVGYSTIGTLRYMSPEQIKAEKLDQRSDLYSLALVFYEMLSGEKAIKAKTTTEIIDEQRYTPPPRLSHEYAYLQDVLNKALAKRPSQRFSDIPSFIKAVTTIYSGKTRILPPPPRFSIMAYLRNIFFAFLIGLGISIVVLVVVLIGKKDSPEKSLPITQPTILESTTATQSKHNTPPPKIKQNTSPTVNINYKQTVEQNSKAILYGSASDEDGRIVSHKWQQTSGEEVDLITPDPNQPQTVFFIVPQRNEISSESLEFVLTVVDNKGATEKSIATINISSHVNNNLETKSIPSVNYVVRVSPYTTLYDDLKSMQRVGQIKQGIKVKVIGIIEHEGKTWNKVEINGKDGFIKSSHLKKL